MFILNEKMSELLRGLGINIELVATYFNVVQTLIRHFILEIKVEKRLIRHATTLKSHHEFLDRPKLMGLH